MASAEDFTDSTVSEYTICLFILLKIKHIAGLQTKMLNPAFVTPPGPHCHNSSERVSNPGFRRGRRALKQVTPKATVSSVSR